jgi:hypothetical protein
MAIGWSPEGTATYARAGEALQRFALTQAVAQNCAWCWGQGYLVQRSTLGWVPVTCPMCHASTGAPPGTGLG